MIRHSSIVAGLLCLILGPFAAHAGDRPPYMDSVLYEGVSSASGTSFLAAADSAVDGAAAAAASAAVADSATTSTPDTLVTPQLAPLPPLRQPHIAIPLTYGVLGGVALGFTAAYAGALIADQGSESSDDLSALGGAIAGFYIGEPLGVALGTHIGNGSQGSFAGDLAISFLTGIVGTAIAVGLQAPGVVIGAGLQLTATALIERRTARDNYERSARARQPSSP
jgi:hypothetical protein